MSSTTLPSFDADTPLSKEEQAVLSDQTRYRLKRNRYMTILTTEEDFVNAIAYHPSGTVVAVATHSDTIEIRDACTGKKGKISLKMKGYVEVRE